ncbi:MULTISPECIES: hypothetical protein [unclassified Aeromonas]|uniref:hypothetical protein n=1 Tax=unclassified Aeromonas TaxID=257493 RepID=UPI0022E4ECAD|nr:MULTISPECIES: hypothetical protein [unclassified Aeromonas]
MYWPDRGSGVPVEPARRPVASAVRQYFTEGGEGVPPTVPGGDWFNQITNEMLNVLEAAGIEPSKADDDQLLQAILRVSKAMSASEALRRSYAKAGYNVVGTFQGGFTIVTASDVGIDETTGKGYTGPVGWVAPGTDPTSGGFVDRSNDITPISFSSVVDMLQGDVPIGALTSSGGTTWRRVSLSTPSVISDYAAITDISLHDFSSLGRCFPN